MKILVAYYSKTGNTRKVAQKIAKQMNADIDEIIDKNNNADKMVMKKELMEISYSKDPSKYDLVIIGSPVWAFNLTPPTRSYMTKNKFQKVAFFSTFGLFSAFTFGKMKSLSKKPIATLKVHMKKVDNCDSNIDEFCNKLAF